MSVMFGRPISMRVISGESVRPLALPHTRQPRRAEEGWWSCLAQRQSAPRPAPSHLHNYQARTMAVSAGLQVCMSYSRWPQRKVAWRWPPCSQNAERRAGSLRGLPPPCRKSSKAPTPHEQTRKDPGTVQTRRSAPFDAGKLAMVLYLFLDQVSVSSLIQRSRA